MACNVVECDDVITYKGTSYEKNNFRPQNFINRSTVLVGKTGSGKSYVANSIFRAISKHVDKMIIFSPSAYSDKSFPCDKYTHRSMIHIDLDMKELEKIYEANTKHTGICTSIRDIVRIERNAKIAYTYCKHYYSRTEEMQMITMISKKVRELKKKYAREINSEKKVVDKIIGSITRRYEQILKLAKLLFVKNNIYDNVCEFGGREFAQALDYIDYNPRVVIFINDLTADINSLKGKGLETFKNLFDRGRHSNLTIIMIIHDFTVLKRAIRGSIHNIIFFAEDDIQHYCNLQNIKGIQKGKFEKASEAIIAKDREKPEEERQYLCLLWMRLENIFEYVRADSRGKQVYVGRDYFSL